ncbi:MAG: hypothetical protein U0840_21190 [Gemmataceae bacterium]
MLFSAESSLSAAQSALEARVHALLPARYQCRLDSVSPTSMGSASLKYAADGSIAWGEIWTHYCELALAGGPPHRGTWLDAPEPEALADDPANLQIVAHEICRGINLASDLTAVASSEPGWVAVLCPTEGMARWMHRAVVAENVFARRAGEHLLVPAGPNFRPAKEVKNVVVALSKTSHYWVDHFREDERTATSEILAANDVHLLGPLLPAERLVHLNEVTRANEEVAHQIGPATALPARPASVAGWVEVGLDNEQTAAWFTRGIIALDVLARREEQRLYLPVVLGAERITALVGRLAQLVQVWRFTQEQHQA